MKKISLVTLFFLVLFVLDASAAKRYWISSGGGKWNNTANWSASSGGSGGSSVPSTNDTAYFDGNGTGNDTLDMNISVKRLDMAAGYTGTIVQGSYTVTLGTGGTTLSGGTFSGGSGSIAASGAFTISGTAFTSTSGTFSATANFTFSSGSFTHNNGKLKFSVTNTITGSITLYDLELASSSSSTFTAASGTTLTVTNDLYYSGSGGLAFNTGTIDVKKNIYLNNTGGTTSGGTGTIKVSGTTKQTIDAHTSIQGTMPNFEINKSDTLVLKDVVCVGGNFTYTSGIIDAGTSTLVFKEGVSKTISGSVSLNNVIFYYYTNNASYTISSGTILTVNGTLTYSGDNGLTLSTGTIHAKGNFTINNTNTGIGGGSAKIILNGSGTQKMTGPTTAAAGRLCDVEIDKSATDTLKLYNTITVLGDWVYTGGIIDAGTSSIYFFNTKTISGTHSLHSAVFYGNTNAVFTISSGTTLTFTGTIGISGGAYNTILNTGTIEAQGSVMVSNTSASSGGSALLKFSGSAVQTITGSGTAGQGRLPKITIDKTGGYLNLASVISVAGNWTYVQGEVKPGTSTVALYGTLNLDGQESGTSNTMAFYNLTAGSGTVTLTGNIDVDNNLKINSGTTLSAGSHTLNVGGEWDSQGTWTYSTSTVVFDGTGYKQVTGASGTTINFYNVTFNKTNHSLTLSRPVKINNAMVLTKGHIKTTSTNYLELPDNATCTGGGIGAYVHGPVRKTGNDAFTFPLGDTTLSDSAAFHPLAITAPSVSTDQFEATYFAVGQTVGDSLVDSLASISSEEYWTLERKAGSSNVTTTLGWNRNSTTVSDLNVARVANWNGVKWLDLGAASINATGTSGTITAQFTPSYSSNTANISYGIQKESVPYALLKKKLDGGYYQAINGRLFFRFDEEYNDADGKLRFNIYDEENVQVTSDQDLPAPLQPAVQYGDNRYQLNTLHCQFSATGALPNGFYIMEVINEKNERWYLRFKQSSTITYSSCYTPPTGE